MGKKIIFLRILDYAQLLPMVPIQVYLLQECEQWQIPSSAWSMLLPSSSLPYTLFKSSLPTFPATQPLLIN